MLDSLGNKCCTIFLSDDPFAGVFYPSESGGGGGGCSYAAAYAYEYVGQSNGEFALEESSSDPTWRTYYAATHKKILWYEYDFLSVKNDGICFVDASAGLAQITYSWADGAITVTPVDWFGAEISAGASKSNGIYAKAMAYLMAVSGSVDFGAVELSATGYVGAIGAEFALGWGEITVGCAPNGVGGSITIRWDCE